MNAHAAKKHKQEWFPFGLRLPVLPLRITETNK